MKAQIEKLMFEAPAFGENAFLAKGGVHLAPCDQFPANSANIPAVATAFNGQYITLSRIGQACDASPNFPLKGSDINAALMAPCMLTARRLNGVARVKLSGPT